VEPAVGYGERKDVGVSGLNSNHKGEVRTKTQGGARVPLSGSTIAKSGERVAGPGL